jgi:hypothetical protein
MRMILITVAASLALTPAVARAQTTKAVTRGEAIELTATVEAIDHDARLITLKDKDGNVETLEAGPEIKRFNELKVGDTVTNLHLRADQVVADLTRFLPPGGPLALVVQGNRRARNPDGLAQGLVLNSEDAAALCVLVVHIVVPVRRPGGGGRVVRRPRAGHAVRCHRHIRRPDRMVAYCKRYI